MVPRDPGVKNASELENIRVVPNPHSVSGLTYPGISEMEQNKINFMNIPGECTIKIYTSGGTLIHTIEHNDGTRLASWDLRTEFNQYPASDMYVFVVESDLGNYIGKFVVIRNSVFKKIYFSSLKVISSIKSWSFKKSKLLFNESKVLFGRVSDNLSLGIKPPLNSERILYFLGSAMT